MKFITLITARGGSKRLPQKNILPLNGIPLIAHSINYAKLEFGNKHQVFVSTDSQEISSISLEYGAEIIQRPEEYASDYATSGMAVQHAANYLMGNGIDYDYIVLLQPTNPLRPKGMIVNAKELIEKVRCNTLVSYTDSHKKLLRMKDNIMQPVNYTFGMRSQDMEKLYYENGLLYVMSRNAALKGIIQEPNSYPYIIEHSFAEVDIDTIEDFKLAEIYLELYKE
jgi:CMP-N-acetylneuraminic acid synthetase